MSSRLTASGRPELGGADPLLELAEERLVALGAEFGLGLPAGGLRSGFFLAMVRSSVTVASRPRRRPGCVGSGRLVLEDFSPRRGPPAPAVLAPIKGVMRVISDRGRGRNLGFFQAPFSNLDTQPLRVRRPAVLRNGPGRITPGVKSSGKRSAGNPHAPFDVARAGDVAMGAGPRPGAKAMDEPPDPTVHASPDPTDERGVETEPQATAPHPDSTRLRLTPRSSAHRPGRKPPDTVSCPANSGRATACEEVAAGDEGPHLGVGHAPG